MAYRHAEQLRWSQMDFVVGYEAKLTQNGKHVPDICDELVGKYPKEFKFSGWHPHCLCYTIPILKTEDEFLLLDDTKPSVNAVTDTPANFKQWVRDNKERIEAASGRGKLPYFLRDNMDAWGKVVYPDKYIKESKKSIQERAKERHAKRTIKDRKRIQDAWNTKLLNDLETDARRIGARGMVYQDAAIRDMLKILYNHIYVNNYKKFIDDYKDFSAYIRGIIESETKAARMAMTDKLFANNMAELASALGIKQEGFMTFFEADELRGNPHYFIDKIYRSNCQTAVVVNELRRRGFDVQAMGNIDGSWLDKLSRGTNKIWRDANGNIPEKTYIGARYENGRWKKTVPNRKQLISRLESNITEDGRYHIDWIWKGSGRERSGHIITIEKIGDTIRYYDPQTGVVITDFYSFIEDIDLSRGIRMLRVDNLQLDTNWASKIVAKAGAKAETGSAATNGIKGRINDLNSISDKYNYKEWRKLVINPNTGGFVVLHKKHQFSLNKIKGAKLSGGQAEKKVAFNLAKQGKQVEMSPENGGYQNSSADLRFDNQSWDVKYIDVANPNTIRTYFKEARKAKNVIFYTSSIDRSNDILSAIQREIGRYKGMGRNIKELPNVYTMKGDGELKQLWIK